ncbi:MAG: Uma2 family endonuclease, partial [Acidobacteria bacterium]
VVQPDVVFVAAANLHIVKDRIWGAPDLVVEVLSPHPRIGRLDERLEWFARYGVRECWLLHQDERRLEIVTFAGRAIDARRSITKDERISSRVLPGFDRPLGTVTRFA